MFRVFRLGGGSGAVGEGFDWVDKDAGQHIPAGSGEVHGLRRALEPMNTGRRDVQNIVELLEGAAAGSIGASQALASWPDPDDEKDETIKSAWHELSHYATDEDIRSRDPEYERFMRENLAALAKRVRQLFQL